MATAVSGGGSGVRAPFGFSFGRVTVERDATGTKVNNVSTSLDFADGCCMGVTVGSDIQTGTLYYRVDPAEASNNNIGLLSLVPDEAERHGCYLLLHIQPQSVADPPMVSLELTVECKDGTIATVLLDTTGGDEFSASPLFNYDEYDTDTDTDAAAATASAETSNFSSAAAGGGPTRSGPSRSAATVEAPVAATPPPGGDDGDDGDDEFEWEGEDDGDSAEGTEHEDKENKQSPPNSSRSNTSTINGTVVAAGGDGGERVEVPRRALHRRVRMVLQPLVWNNFEVNLPALISTAFEDQKSVRYARCLAVAIRVGGEGGGGSGAAATVGTQQSSCLVQADVAFRAARSRTTNDLVRKLEGEAFKFRSARTLSFLDPHDIDFGGLAMNGGLVLSLIHI